MEEAEEVLARGMVATITGTRPSVSPADVEASLHAMFELQHDNFTVHKHAPEDFLIIFSSRLIMDRMASDHLINAARFSLLLRPWCKLAHATAGSFAYSVQLELRGIPAQAWHLSTAEHILGTGCWVERLHPDTRSRADLAVFRLTGRVRDLASIRRDAILEIVEHVPADWPDLPPAVRTLEYPISIRLVRSAALPRVVDDATNGEIGRAHV